MSSPPSSASSHADASHAPIAILGGSSAFTPALAHALAAAARDLPPLTIALYGRDATRTAVVARFCTALAASRRVPHRYLATTDLDTAVRGAIVVVNTVRAGGFAGRHHDETFPLAFGYPGDETIGPGGLASALRAVPVTLALARAVAARAPDAWFLNMANPMSILLAALRRIDGLRSFGLCELPMVTLAHALALLGAPAGEVRTRYLGVNHQGFFVRIERAGEDLLPRLWEAMDAAPERAAALRVDADVMRRIRALPLPYLRLYYHGERELAALRTRRSSRAQDLEQLSQDLYRAYEAEPGVLPPELTARATPWLELALVPAIGALLGGPPARLYVSSPNEGEEPDLPFGAIIERSATIDRRGPQLEQARPLADHQDLVRFVRAVIAYEEHAARAAETQTDDDLVAALESHPFGVSHATALAMLGSLRPA